MSTLLARALATLDIRAGGRLAVACISLEDLEQTGAEEADSDGVIDHLRAIRGVAVAAVIREPRAGGGTVKKASLRSATASPYRARGSSGSLATRPVKYSMRSMATG